MHSRVRAHKPPSSHDLSFLQTYPEIKRNVKNYHIASYQGITTESLSRVRKGLAKM
ncbi:hypothetical protein [Neolewinella persica]|uniref:hypothetical protein n=1 Tax=Neolewinella persica TaxID=70998 RepID=UPI0003A909B4|nr:hypothetical protein [Neolewinella persica]